MASAIRAGGRRIALPRPAGIGRGEVVPAADAVNEAGGLAYAMPPKHALAQYAATGCLNQTRQNDCGSSVNFRVSVPAGPCFMGVCPGHLNMLWDDVVMEEVLERTYDD